MFAILKQTAPSSQAFNNVETDQDKGAELLKKVLCGYVDADILAKYTVLAGTYCLVSTSARFGVFVLFA